MHPLFKRSQKIVDNIVKKSTCTSATDALRLNHYIWLALISIPLSIAFIIKNAFANNTNIAIVVTILMVSMTTSLIIIPKIKRLSIVYHVANFIFLVVIVLVSIWGNKSEGQILWGYMYPVLSIFLFGNRLGVKWSLLMLATLFFGLGLNGKIDFTHSIDFEIRFAVIYLTILSVTSWLEYYRNRYTDKSLQQRQALETERESLNKEIAQRIQLEEELKKLANHDGLTDLYNRRYFLERANREIARSQRYGIPLSLALIDIDKFKNVNDTYGHPAGDEILRCFGHQCKELLRESDIAGRLGGEEFAILLLHVSAEESQQIMDRFRQKINEYPFSFDGKQLHITISIGLTELDNVTTNLDQMYSTADKALYQAKERGRNQLVFS